MARYFFHTIDGMFQPDSVGEEFETLVLAKSSAVLRAANFLNSRPNFFDGNSMKIVVTDVAGESLFELDMAGKTYN